MTMVLSLILALGSVSHAGQAERIARVEREADRVAAAIYRHLELVNELETSLRDGRLRTADLRPELARLAAQLDDEAAPVRELIERAPWSPRQWNLPQRPDGTVALVIGVSFVSYLAAVGTLGTVYHHFTAPSFTGTLGDVAHVGASVAVGWTATPLVILTLVKGGQLIVRTLRRLRGVLNQDQLREVFFARLGSHGIRMDDFRHHRLAPAPSQFGGAYGSDAQLIKNVADQIGVDLAKAGDPRVALAETVADRQMFDAFPLVDLLTTE